MRSCAFSFTTAKKALNNMNSGQILHVVATDPGSIKDFEAFARQTGNELIEANEVDGEFMFLVKKL